MFVILLKFAANKDKAAWYMVGHKAWLARGFDDGVFLMAGSLKAGQGGGIVAHNTTLAALEARVNEDPFVAETVVQAEILEISPSRTDDRLAFLMPEMTDA
ncbi:MAG: hypothetical protein RIM72_01545 [Alphaproteobacteria bacterium]